MLNLVLVQHDNEEPVWHVRCDMPANFHTLCSLGLDDGAMDEGGDFTGARVLPDKPRRGQKCTCHQCFEVWSAVTSLNLSREAFVHADS